MKTVPDTKYHLRDLYQEISLFDRKISHCQNYESFSSEAERSEAVAKLETKRDDLLKVARGMVARGVEYNVDDLPRSMKSTADAKEL